MKTIAIHSHKGGVGKTTVALLLAKHAAITGLKVCVVDFDFIGSGMTDLFALKKRPARFLDHFFQHDDPYKFEIDQLLGRYTDSDMNGQELLVMFNRGEGLPSENDSNLRDRMVGLMANESRYREIQSKSKILHRKLEETDVDLLIIDCHPGLGFVSGTIGALATLNVYLTTPNRSDCLGLFKSLNAKQLDGPASFLILNMAPPSLIDTTSFRQLVEQDPLVGTTAGMLLGRFEYVAQSNQHFAAVPESDFFRHILYLGSSTKLPPIVAGRSEFSFCSKILALNGS